MSVYGTAAARWEPSAPRPWLAQAREDQLPPTSPWTVWLVLAGRGWGKTRSGAEWLLAEALRAPGTTWVCVAPTFGACRDTCAEGPSGLLNVALPGEVVRYVRSLGEIRLLNGSTIYLRSADEPDRLRGLNLSGAWADELAAWRYEATWWEGLIPAVRIDPARVVVTTTPRPTALLRSLMGRSDGSVSVTRGSTFDNAANLSVSALTELRARYAGTRLGRQELGGELLEDVEGSLFSSALLEESRVPVAPELDRVVVGVDPAVSSGPSSDETGIVAVGCTGRRGDAHFFVLEDVSVRGSPQVWASAVVRLFGRRRADRVVCEVNQGGDLVESTLRTVAPDLPIRKVHATRGKAVRAEPVAALLEQGRLHMVGSLPMLEEQLSTWVPGVGRSPDRADALVWAVSSLMSGGRGRHVVYLDNRGETSSRPIKRSGDG